MASGLAYQHTDHAQIAVFKQGNRTNSGYDGSGKLYRAECQSLLLIPQDLVCEFYKKVEHCNKQSNTHNCYRYAVLAAYPAEYCAQAEW